MKFILGLTFLIFFASTLGVAAQIHASIGSGDYVILRANISPLYIENESVIIKVISVAFQGNKPTGESLSLYIKIEGINVNYTWNSTYLLLPGHPRILQLPALSAGHYDMILYSAVSNLKSREIDQDFGVTKAPVPYYLSFSQDGGKIFFRSLKLNKTGVPDPKFPFRLEIYEYVHGSGESLITSYTNVTNLTITVPLSWRGGILYVEVQDVYGWRNSATIDLAKMQFEGIPLSYDYNYMHREPFASRYPLLLIISIVLLYVSIRALARWYDGK